MNGVTSNIDQNIDLIEGLETYYDRGFSEDLRRLAVKVQQMMLAGNFKNRTGALRRSMKAMADGDSIIVEMLSYGWFLSFGVNGKNRKQAIGLTEGVAGAFGVNEGYKFGQSSDKVWGIAPRNFYPLDLEEQIIELLENGNSNNN